MNMVVCIINLIISGLCVRGIYIVKQKNTVKKQKGNTILGKKVGCQELWGRPNRYIVDVEFVVNNVNKKSKITTTDRRIKDCDINSQISLIYVEKSGEIYWADEKSIQNVIIILLLVILCVFAIILAFVFAIRVFM